MSEESFPLNFNERSANELKTEREFWDAMYDAKNQFNLLQFGYHLNKDINSLLEENSAKFYLNFLEYIKQNNNWVLSEKMLANENVKGMIHMYDELVSFAKNVHSKEDIAKLLEEREEFIQEFNLGLDKS